MLRLGFAPLRMIAALDSLRIGCVKYLNARPLIHGWPGPVVFDDPSVLSRQLARGDLDVALVSSFEFLRNPIYRIVDAISIVSDGPVYSVIVAHRGRISDIEEIALDPASQTSTNLLHCLLAELGIDARLFNTTAEEANCSRLLIGDQAIRFRSEHESEFQFWDLGAAWKQLVGLPFVYALWLVRPEVAYAQSIAKKLRALRDENLRNIDDLAAGQNDFPPNFCHRYWRENIRFGFGRQETKGLQAFADLCVRHDLLPRSHFVFDFV
jgi:predicted solute-binding protein